MLIKNRSFRTLEDMFSDRIFTDVTIVTEDYIEFKAHKIVLNFASPFFSKILTKSSDHNTVFFLKGVSGEVFKHIILFIYLGEVKIPWEILRDFLVAANDLQINGLESLNSNHEEGNVQEAKPESNKIGRGESLEFENIITKLMRI